LKNGGAREATPRPVLLARVQRLLRVEGGMNLVIGFAPFILFSIFSRLSADLALWLAFAAAFVVTIRDFVESPSLRLLDAGSFVLFALLALVRGFLAPNLSLVAVRFIAEAFLLLLLGLPLLWKKPFSIEYARLDPREAGWPQHLFLKVNYLVSGAWTMAFLIMAAADGAVAFDPELPLYASVAISVVALALAVTFTLRYPALAAKRLNG
jgi:hypothetical protein